MLLVPLELSLPDSGTSSIPVSAATEMVLRGKRRAAVS